MCKDVQGCARMYKDVISICFVVLFRVLMLIHEQWQKWNDYAEIACKPSIEEAGIGFDIENKSDGENSVSVRNKKRMWRRITDTFDSYQYLLKHNDCISNYKSMGCQLLSSSGLYLLAFEFESKEKIKLEPQQWMPTTTNDHVNVKLNEPRSDKRKDQLFRVLRDLANHYNIHYDKHFVENYEDIKPLVECFDVDLFKVT